MGRRFAELAFTSAVKEQQTQHGSHEMYDRVERTGPTSNFSSASALVSDKSA